MAHVRAGTIAQSEDIVRVPGRQYIDPERWQQEVDLIFKRLPLMLAMSCELNRPGAFKTLEICGVPILLVRGDDLVTRAYINSCSHRGAIVVTERRGEKKRFSCPYHAWTYDRRGELVSVYAEEDFGAIDKSCHGLTALPVAERAGMIWVSLDTRSDLNIDDFLCGYDQVLEEFGFANWSFFAERTLDGPNWKIAYDGYLDLYHLPILHRRSFGENMPNQALYDAWGPHQRVTSPDPGLLKLADKPETDWPTQRLLAGVWTIFPHISIASFDGGGGRGVMVSQLFPGDAPGASVTVQNYVLEQPPADDETAANARAQFEMLGKVVREEDYAAGFGQQKALSVRPDAEVLFGRNEGGGQHFHGFVDRLLNCETADLSSVFGAKGC
jgi:phenylpropionate dioxygenase-like ring-hydroxylating dioxygenase large terminal subunit